MVPQYFDQGPGSIPSGLNLGDKVKIANINHMSPIKILDVEKE